MALVAGLAKAHGEKRLDEKLVGFTKAKLPIVDELGYLPLEPDAAHLFFQLVSRRYETRAMLIMSNRSGAEWGCVRLPGRRCRHPRLALHPPPEKHEHLRNRFRDSADMLPAPIDRRFPAAQRSRRKETTYDSPRQPGDRLRPYRKCACVSPRP